MSDGFCGYDIFFSEKVLQEILTTQRLPAQKKYLINEFRMEGIHRREQPVYPLAALREVLINALIHRNYNSTASTQIRVTMINL